MQEQEIPEEENQSEELYEHFNIIVDKGQQLLRIDKFLVNRLENTSRHRIKLTIDANCILVNGKVVKPNYKVKPLDSIVFVLPKPPRDTQIYPENIPLNIVYEDDYLVIVNKEAGMVVHPGYNNYTGTLVNALVYHFEQLPTGEGDRPPGLVHRIDKDTSGLLVVAKDEITLTLLAKQFFDHTIERKYNALVWGVFENDEGTITGNLARSLRDRRVMSVYQDENIGKSAVTHYKVLERFNHTTLVECKLETGRTHQIRVHMQYIKHPVFNDAMYGGNVILSGPKFTKYKQFIDNCFELCPRQALHARTLGFTHPITGQEMFFEAPLPKDMESLIEKWREYSKMKMWQEPE